MSDSSTIKQLVDLLKGPPMNLSTSLVEFSNKSALDLLQLVNDIFHTLDPHFQSKSVRDEESEQTAKRIFDFLIVLGYKPAQEGPESFGPPFMSGSPSVVYPCILWLLTRFDSLKKRAYLGHFLRPAEVPEELFADPAIVGLFQKYKVAQSEFKDIHKQVDKARESALKPEELQREVNQLELEREQLKNKLSKLNGRLEMELGGENEGNRGVFNDMLISTNLLRLEQEEEARLYGNGIEQKGKLLRSEQLKAQTMKKWTELSSMDLNRADPAKLMQKLRAEVADRRAYCDEKLEQLIVEREKQLKSLSKVLSGETYSEDNVMELEGNFNAIREEVNRLERKIAESNAKTDGQLGFLRDRIQGAEKRKEKLQEQLNELMEERKEVEDDLRRIENDLRMLNLNGEKPKSEAQHKAYMAELAQKKNVYVSLKAELEALKEEVKVLAGTESVLKGRAENLKEFTEQLEKEKGIAGYASTEENLASVSNLKAQIDASKGETLEEISGLVEKITATLKERKNKLAPQIKELRSVRSQFEDLEGMYNEKKKAYESMCVGYETERLKLEQDVALNRAAINEEESSFHFLHCLTRIAKVRANQLHQEARYLSGEEKFPDKEYRSYKDMLEKEIAREEMRAKQLRNEKKYVTEKHDSHVQQRQLFGSLRYLLQKKYEIAKGQSQLAQGIFGATQGTGGRNQTDLGEAERMVFD